MSDTIYNKNKKKSPTKIAINIVVVVLILAVIAVGGFAIYKVFFDKKREIAVYPTPVTGTDYTAEANKKAAVYGKTRTVCIRGRSKGLLDSSTVWTGFLVSEDGYIVTSHSRSQSGVGIAFVSFTDYEITVLDSNNNSTVYYASPTAYFDTLTDIKVIKIKDVPIGTKFDFFQLEASSTVDFGAPILIMDNPVPNVGLTAHSASIGNPSTTYKSAANHYNDYTKTDIILINGAVNNGSKGAPLINADCKIIGMILSRYIISSNSGVNDVVMDMGFAAKSDDIIALISKIEVTV